MRIVRNSIIYTTVLFLQRAAGFFLLPFYTSFLTPRDYGVISVVTAYTGLLSLFCTWMLEGAGFRFESKYAGDPEKVKRIWGALLIFAVANTCVLMGLVGALHRFLVDPFMKGIGFYPFVALGLLSTAATVPTTFYTNRLRAQQSAGEFALNSGGNWLVGVGLTIVLVASFRMQATGVLLAGALTAVLFLIPTLIRFLPRVRLAWDGAALKESFAYSLPILPHALAGWVMAMVDRVFLNGMCGTASVGIYTIGYQFGNVMNVITYAVNQAYSPWFMEKMGGGAGGKEKVVRVAGIVTTLYGVLGLGLAYFSQDLLPLMVTSSYRRAWEVIPLLAFSYVFNGLYYFFINPLFLEKTKLVPAVTFIGAAVNVGLHALLIPRFGMMGAAAANFLGSALCSALALYFCLRFEPVAFRWRGMFVRVSVLFLLALVVFLRGGMPWPVFLGLKIAVLAVVIPAVVWHHREDLREAAEAVFGRMEGSEKWIRRLWGDSGRIAPGGGPV